MIATIHFHRPDVPLPVIGDNTNIIPLNAPYNFFIGTRYTPFHSQTLCTLLCICFLIVVNMLLLEGVPGVGELMLASFPPLNFFHCFAANNWYISLYLVIFVFIL